MEKDESDLFLYLAMDELFIERIKSSVHENNVLEPWIERHPEHAPEIRYAKDFVESLRFREGKLSKAEMYELLVRITGQPT